MWGKSSNSHFGKSDTTVVLILYQKEKKKSKKLVCFISHLFFTQDEAVPPQGGAHEVHPSFKDGSEAPGFPSTGGFELYLFIFQPHFPQV